MKSKKDNRNKKKEKIEKDRREKEKMKEIEITIGIDKMIEIEKEITMKIENISKRIIKAGAGGTTTMKILGGSNTDQRILRGEVVGVGVIKIITKERREIKISTTLLKIHLKDKT